MNLSFSKYHGTGNDFIIIDNRSLRFDKTRQELIGRLCHRRFGIGADGLLLFEQDDESDFRMIYFNSDGRPGTMCGNGARCLVAYAGRLGVIGNQTRFSAVDGKHEARIISSDKDFRNCIVRLRMKDVDNISIRQHDVILDTGSPHYVRKVESVGTTDVNTEGKRIRNSPAFAEEGINVNFVQPDPEAIIIRTYERGVESETFSCGTGSVAAALAAVVSGWIKPSSPVMIKTRGGNLWVHFSASNGHFTDIFLEGPAYWVFDGQVNI